MERPSPWAAWTANALANAAGTLLAAAVIYLIGVAAGVITTDTLVTVASILSVVAAGAASSLAANAAAGAARGVGEAAREARKAAERAARERDDETPR